MAAVVQLVPAAVLAPPLSAYGDRVPRGTALVAAYAGVAATDLATCLALLGDTRPVVVITASTLVTTAVAVARPLHFAAIPQLAGRPEELVSANALSSVVEGIALFAGPALAGVVVALAGPWAVAAGCTAAAGVAMLLCLRLGLTSAGDAGDGGDSDGGGDSDDGEEPSTWRAATQGLRVLRGDGPSLTLLLVMTADFVLAGALDVMGVSFATSGLGLDESGAGLLIGSIGIGGLLGALTATTSSRLRSLAPVVVAGGAIQGGAFALVALTSGLAPATAAVAVSGFGGTLMLVGGRTLLQRATDDRVLARVFAVQESASLLGLALGAGLAPVLVDRFGANGAFVPLGGATVLLASGGWLMVRRLDARAVFLPQETALLRGVAFLSLLPPYELERLARAATWVPITAGDVVVRQGEAGSSYYVVAHGELAVDVDGERRPVPLVAGNGFGEIALLHAVPRTATVTALTDGRLLQVASGDFLAAVTGSEDGRRVAAEVADAHLQHDAAMQRLRGDGSARAQDVA